MTTQSTSPPPLFTCPVYLCISTMSEGATDNVYSVPKGILYSLVRGFSCFRSALNSFFVNVLCHPYNNSQYYTHYISIRDIH